MTDTITKFAGAELTVKRPFHTGSNGENMFAHQQLVVYRCPDTPGARRQRVQSILPGQVAIALMRALEEHETLDSIFNNKKDLEKTVAYYYVYEFVSVQGSNDSKGKNDQDHGDALVARVKKAQDIFSAEERVKAKLEPDHLVVSDQPFYISIESIIGRLGVTRNKGEEVYLLKGVLKRADEDMMYKNRKPRSSDFVAFAKDDPTEKMLWPSEDVWSFWWDKLTWYRTDCNLFKPALQEEANLAKRKIINLIESDSEDDDADEQTTDNSEEDDAETISQDGENMPQDKRRKTSSANQGADFDNMPPLAKLPQVSAVAWNMVEISDDEQDSASSSPGPIMQPMPLAYQVEIEASKAFANAERLYKETCQAVADAQKMRDSETYGTVKYYEADELLVVAQNNHDNALIKCENARRIMNAHFEK